MNCRKVLPSRHLQKQLSSIYVSLGTNCLRPRMADRNLKQVVVGRYGVLYQKPPQQDETGLASRSRVIDLRSDTVTKPTEEMRVAMFEAEVGDDVFGDDPTVNRLEEKAAEVLGKEAAMFVPSGTMGNLICVLTHCSRRGDEALIGEMSHISQHEQGGIAQLGGVHPRTVRNLPDGTLDLEDLKSKIQPDEFHHTTTRLICVENTHGLMGGQPIRPEFMEKVAGIVRGTDIRVHVDGARLFNAATALGLPASQLVKHADSVSICLSKGLGAPVGSVIAGKREFIRQARRLRKALGGGMRQAGVLAAPGLLALEKMSKRLQTDHDNAQQLGKGLAELKDLGIRIDLASVQTNIIIFSLVREGMSATEFAERLESLEEGGDEDGGMKVSVQLLAFEDKLRVVTHHQLDTEDIDLALGKMKKVLSN